MPIFSGRRYGRWTAIARAGNRRWLFRCDCGTEKRLYPTIMTRKTKPSRSCGCLASELIAKRNTTHGMSKINMREYRIWCGMRHRCNNPRDRAYQSYGGRGIKVCDQWLDFTNFLADMGRSPPGSSLDRIDNDRGYEPGNCRWATQRQQARNTRTNRLIEINGDVQCVMEWAERFGLPYGRVLQRLTMGWSPEEALELTPRIKWAGTRRAQPTALILSELQRRAG